MSIAKFFGNAIVIETIIMDEQKQKRLDSHRRMNEIGGILLGIGVGVAIALHLGNNGFVSLISVLALISGLALLVYEQKKWNKFKKGRGE